MSEPVADYHDLRKRCDAASGWSVVCSGVLRVVEGRPLAARSLCPEGPWRLASPGCRGVASRSRKTIILQQG